MPYIAFDLDAISSVPDVARHAGTTDSAVAWGLLRLWQWCWRIKTDVVSRDHLRGFFGCDPAEALLAFGFLSADAGEQPDGSRTVAGNIFRVRGAEKYLKISEGRRKGGLAAKGNLRKGRQPEKSAGSEPETQPGTNPGSLPALTSTIQHPTSNTTTTAAAAAAASGQVGHPTEKPRVPLAYEKPSAPEDAWTGDDFWAWVQWARQRSGLIAERDRPRDLGSWYSTALMTPGVTVAVLRRAFGGFGKDKHWEKQGFPFKAFMSQWEQFANKELANAD